MKILKYSLLFASLLLLAGVMSSCKDDEGNGAGDAVVGFASPAYVYKESAGTVRIPIQITGEPKKYPIVFNVEATIEGNAVSLDKVARFLQLTGLRYVGNPKAPVFIEMELLDNAEINDSRFVKLTITSADGATVQNGTATIEVADNDNNPYDKLWGNWTFSGASIDKDDNGKIFTFDVNISGGFTEEEIAANTDKKLVCWGFGGNQHSVSATLKAPVWNINYDAETESLSVAVNSVMAPGGVYNFSLGEDAVVKSASILPTGGDFNYTAQIPATFSKDFNTITFTPGFGFVATVWGVSGKYYGFWYGYDNIVMTRKK